MFMKILLLISEYPPIGGGAGNAGENIARLMGDMGNEVLVLTTTFDSLPLEETRHGVRIRRIPALRQRLDRSTVIEQVSFMLSACLHILGVARQFSPQITLAFFGLPSGAVAWFLKLFTGLPYVVSLRGGDVPGFRPYDFRLYHRLAAPLLHKVWRQASAVVANSRGLRDLASAFDHSVEISIISNGVDLGKFSLPTRDWSKPRVLSVGRVVHQKGFDLGMRALAGLTELDWQWRIAGDGPQLVALQAMAREYGLSDRIQFLGWQTPEQLREQYAFANLFLFPSRHEGMPNVVLEAMARGLPVVATRIAGNEELVADGKTGILVPPEDMGALRESLRKILVDADARERLGLAAREKVEQSFSWERVAGEYHTILKNVIEEQAVA